MEINNISFNAAWVASMTEEAFVSKHLEKFKDRAVFARRNTEQRTEWLKNVYALCCKEVGKEPDKQAAKGKKPE